MIAGVMRDFQVLFDHGEGSELLDPAMARYGKLGFPAPLRRSVRGSTPTLCRPSMASSRCWAMRPSGSDIGGLPEDRWLMDLLRAHADAVILGMGTLRDRAATAAARRRAVPSSASWTPGCSSCGRAWAAAASATCWSPRARISRLSDYAVFDGAAGGRNHRHHARGRTQARGPARAPSRGGHPRHGRAPADGIAVDLRQAVAALQQRYGIRYLLCEGGPSLYSGMLAAGADRRKVPDRFADRGGSAECARPEADRAAGCRLQQRRTRCAGAG